MKKLILKTTLLGNLLFLSLAIVSCTNVSENENKIIHIDDESFIDLNIEQILKFSSHTGLEFIKESALSSHTLFLPESKGYFVLDKRQRLLFHFDKDGRFIQKIGDVGKGPNEYVRLWDVKVTNQGFSFLTGGSETKIFKYDQNGEFQESISYLPEQRFAFGIHPKTEELFFLGKEHLTPRITIVDPVSKTIRDTFLTCNGYAPLGSDHNFSISESQNLIFFTSMDNLIYELTSDTIRVKYQLEYRSDYPIYNEIDQTSYEKLDKLGFWMIHRVLENKDWIYLCISIGSNTRDEIQEGYHLLINRNTGKVFSLPGRWQDQNDFSYAFYLDEKNTLYIPMEPAKILDNQDWQEYFAGAGDIPKEDANPIVLKISLDKLIQD